MERSDDDMSLEGETHEVQLDIKALTHECTHCAAPGILLSYDPLGNGGWYCEDHIDHLVVNAALCAAIENEGGGAVATKALAATYLHRLGWDKGRIVTHLGVT